LEKDPVLIDLHGTAAKRYILPTTLPTLSTTEEEGVEIKKPTEYTLVGVFDRSGQYIYSGTSRGHFNVIDAQTREVLSLKDQRLYGVSKVISSVQCRNKTHPILVPRSGYLRKLRRSSRPHHPNPSRPKLLYS
jgi:hypothetical protein